MRHRSIRIALVGVSCALAVLVTSVGVALAGKTPTFKASLAKVGPQDGGGEPSIASGPNGELYVSWPGAHFNFARSFNGGSKWSPGGMPQVESVGDTSVNVDGSGAVYESDLHVVETSTKTLQAEVFKSFDKGATWPQSGQGFADPSDSSNSPAFVDRQWVDAYIPPGKTTNDALVYLQYHDFVPSQIWVNTSTDGGRHFGPPVDVITDATAQADTFCNSIPGGVKVVQSGPHAGRVYVAWLAADVPTSVATGCNITQADTFHSIWTAWSDDQGQTWTDQLVFDGGFGHDASGLFADLALDDQGNPYVGFVDNLTGEWDMYVMASFDGGTTWNGKSDGTGVPYKVNADTGTHFFPAIAVGDPGKVDVAYIATDKIVPTTPYGKPSPGGDPSALWYVYMAQSLNLTSGAPTWQVVKATPNPIHQGDVCVLGIACVFPSSDRSLLDFIDLAIDPRGVAHAAYTANYTPSATGIYAANQTGGARVIS